ncbi:PQQ-dependent sugar dehydrogenase [Catalinimonas niigatensis]|uniref:PQQ-dependent sugar dehydrogenase n=1 Tax=Catalinimonas niigatensis TaxID=1397264 RepID=UPI002665CD1E|nr:PQQ-dependent sugar dehydrogenase [Catalinimonas niigatensis]WPP51435.1 PQQ-dependent sugar dehydrogenase [Catalinimonas niigatensis]
MQKLIICLLAFFTSFTLYAQDNSVAEGPQIYKTYCAGCHGAQLQGSSAGALIKTDWIYGRGKGALTKNIRFGIPGTEMAAWNTVLNDEQINAVADFILEAQETPPAARRPIPAQINTEDYVLNVEQLVSEGIVNPWAIEFVDESRALISERGGKLRWLIDGKLDKQEIKGVPPTFEEKTGGYMDIALDPNYADNGWVYLAFSHTDGNMEDKEAPAMTKIIRAKIKDHQWTEEQALFEVADSLLVVNGNRWGCRFLFDQEGLLYFSIGDMDQAMASQELGKATGKVFRIKADGSIPEDNPFVDEEGALPAIFTIGNRNVQGLDQHPVTGEIWASEHGPMGGDELNIMRKGNNYGWPVITYGIDYSGEIVSEKTLQEGMEQPITEWTPSIAVCPIEFNSSPLFPKWQNNLLVGALAYEELRRLVIEDEQVISQEMILKNLGRVRDIKSSPDGALYVVLNNPDVILRITPEEEL